MILASNLRESVSTQNYSRYRSFIPGSSQSPSLASWDFPSVVNFSLVLFLFYVLPHLGWYQQQTGLRCGSHNIYGPRGSGESQEANADTHTHRGRGTHTQSESRRAVAKEWSFDSMKKMLQAFQLTTPHTSISLKRIPTDFNRSIQVTCK